MVIGFGQRVTTYENLIPQKSMCQGCHDDFYNGNNPMSIKGCWHFENAKVVDSLFYPGSWATDADRILLKETLSCYRGT